VAVQPIRLFGDPVLRQRAVEVDDFDKEVRQLVTDLTDTMLAAPGAGLAAPQIGVGLRVFTWHVEGQVGHLVNPSLELSADTQDGAEGCLSLPELTYDCLRALSVVATGILFIDRLDTAARKAAMKEIRESEWFGLEKPTVRVSPHATHGLGR
jgi:peptide deformylase